MDDIDNTRMERYTYNTLTETHVADNGTSPMYPHLSPTANAHISAHSNIESHITRNTAHSNIDLFTYIGS